VPKKLLRIPSPSLVISVVAMVLAAGAGSFAIAALSGKDVKRIATKAAKLQVKKSAQAPLKANCRDLGIGGLPSGISAIAKDGSVTCTRGSVTALNLGAPAGGSTQTQVGDLGITDICRNPSATITKMEFTNVGANGGSLNWGYIDAGNTAHASGTSLPGSALQDIDFASGRIEGQFIFSTFDNATSEGQKTTVSLHAVDLGSSCDVAGTVQTARFHD